MSLYTGSNYGVISSANSGTGTLVNPNDTTTFSYENIQNYTSGTILINLTTNGYATLTLYYSNNISGTITSTQKYVFTKTGSETINFPLDGSYLKVELTANIAGVGYTIQTKYNNTGGNYEISDGILSASNSKFIPTTSSSSPILANATLSGSYDEIVDYSLITILISGTIASGTAAANGTINCYFSSDGVNIDRTVSYPVQDCTAITTTSTSSTTFNPAHTLLPISKYFKVDYINGSKDLTSLKLSVLYHTNKSKAVTSRVTQFLTDYVDSDTVRTILNGRTEGTTLPGGNYQNIDVSNGSVNVKIKEPITAFGEVLIAQLTPHVQFDFTNGRPLDKIRFYQNDTANTSYNFIDSKAQINASGSSSPLINRSAQIEMLSNIFTKYKPGQGCDNRFTARFPSGYIDDCDQYAGIFTAEDALLFGYFGIGSSPAPPTEFSIKHAYFGTRQINRFTITSNATSTSTLVLDFGGTAINVSITSGDTPLIISKKINDSLQSVSLNTYGWSVTYYTLTGTNPYYVECIYNVAQSTEINVDIITNGTGASISRVLIRAGVDPTVELIPQSQWNIDTCMDMGSLQQNYILNKSGFRLDPTKGNVFKISFQYLGFGSITFFIELPESETLVPVHRIKYVNSNLKPSMKNPNMQLGIGIKQSGFVSASAIVETASMASFVQGLVFLTGLNRSYGFTLTGNSNITGLSRLSPGVIFGLKNLDLYQSVNSNSSINYAINNNNIVLSTINFAINAATNTTANIIFMLVKNPTVITVLPLISGSSYPSFIRYNENLVSVINGVPTTNTAGISITGGTIILEFSLSENQNLSEVISNLNLEMSKYDSYYLCFYGTASANIDISGSLSYQINM